MQVLYSHGIPEFADSESTLLAALAAEVAARHPAEGPFQLVLTDDELIATLNRDYRGHDRPTDVLSFDYGRGDEHAETDAAEVKGEIYISLERARQQAAERQIPLLDEVARLLVHGLLHLSGYDHETEEELLWMESETDILLRDSETVLAGSIARKE